MSKGGKGGALPAAGRAVRAGSSEAKLMAAFAREARTVQRTMMLRKAMDDGFAAAKAAASKAMAASTQDEFFAEVEEFSRQADIVRESIERECALMEKFGSLVPRPEKPH